MANAKIHLTAIKAAGRITGLTHRYLSFTWRKLLSVGSLFGSQRLSIDDIRAIVQAEFGGQGVLSQEEYNRRLQVLTERIHALQETIAELKASGRFNAQTVSLSLDSINREEQFSADEKNILATILKQNIALQKPELAKKKAS
jgi:uncharacterized membrane protein